MVIGPSLKPFAFYWREPSDSVCALIGCGYNLIDSCSKSGGCFLGEQQTFTTTLFSPSFCYGNRWGCNTISYVVASAESVIQLVGFRSIVSVIAESLLHDQVVVPVA